MIKIPQKSSETVKNRQYNDQDTTEVIRNHCLFFTVSDDFCGILIIVLSVLYGFWWLLWYHDHCIVCSLRFLMTSVVSWSDNTMIKIPQKSSETVKNRQYNDHDTTEGIRNRKGQTMQWSRYHRSHIIVLSVLYGFWWLLWYHDHCIVCSLRFLMTSVVSWSLYCLFFTVSDDFCGILIQTMQWSRYHRSHQKPYRTDNTMIKIPQKSSETVKNRQYNDHDTTEVIRNRRLLWYLDHCIVCSLRFLMTSVVSWSLYCLFFTVSESSETVKDRHYNDQDTTEVIRNRKEQTLQWSWYHRSHQKP
jgi:hypothetical protein